LRGIRNWKNPLWSKTADIGFIDLSQCRVSIAAGIAMVRRPVLLGCDLAKSIRLRFAQYMNFLIIREQLEDRTSLR